MTDPPLFTNHPLVLPASTRLRGAAVLGAAGFLLGAALVWAQDSQRTSQQDTPPRPAATGGKTAAPTADYRIREGTEIVNQLGHFRTAGDRLTFFPADGNSRLVGLENLNLERIARMIADSPALLQWKVSGTVTEFTGANYLLVQRAILTTQVQQKGDSARRQAGPLGVGQ